MLGIGTDLAQLRPVHLPLLALAVSLTTPLAFNLQFLLLGLEPRHAFLANTFAMSFGDFLGCLIALATARLVIAVARRRLA